jgi:hypothetical protein
MCASMTDAPLGIVRDYDDLRALLRRMAEVRNISRKEIDRLAGWPDGLAEKALAEEPLRNLGPATIAGGLGALGLMLVAVEDPDALAKFTARAEQRDGKQVRSSHRMKLKPKWLWSRRKAREMALKQKSVLGAEGLRKRARKGHQTRKRRRQAAKAALVAKNLAPVLAQLGVTGSAPVQTSAVNPVVDQLPGNTGERGDLSRRGKASA